MEKRYTEFMKSLSGREGEIETYGLLEAPPWDSERKLMKINFFGSPTALNWKTEEIEIALDQLRAGRAGDNGQ